MNFGRRAGVVVTALAAAFSLGASTQATQPAAAAATTMPSALLAVVARDDAVVRCAKDLEQSSAEYAAHAFTVSEFVMRGGEPMTLLEANTGCMCNGTTCRALVYERRADGYRRVLDEYELFPHHQVRPGGSAITLSTYESDWTMFEATYVWNGAEYAFDPFQTHEYDTVTKTRRIYETLIRFEPGTDSATLASYTTRELNKHYVARARAGQTMSVEMLSHTGRAPTIGVYFAGQKPNLVGGDATRWSGRVPSTGVYDVYVLSTEQDYHAPTRFQLRITIR